MATGKINYQIIDQQGASICRECKLPIPPIPTLVVAERLPLAATIPAHRPKPNPIPGRGRRIEWAKNFEKDEWAPIREVVWKRRPGNAPGTNSKQNGHLSAKKDSTFVQRGFREVGDPGHAAECKPGIRSQKRPKPLPVTVFASWGVSLKPRPTPPPRVAFQSVSVLS